MWASVPAPSEGGGVSTCSAATGPFVSEAVPQLRAISYLASWGAYIPYYLLLYYPSYTAYHSFAAFRPLPATGHFLSA